MRLWLLVLLAVTMSAGADDTVERALIQRDQQSAEFAAGADRRAMENFNAEQLRQPLPEGSRERLRRERDAFQFQRSAPQPPAAPDYAPSALPGGPAPAVDPIPLNRRGG